MKNRVIAMLLAAVLCLGILGAMIPSALAFSDISDSKTAEAAEILRLLGAVNGTGGQNFSPSVPLTRASFCKMALEIAGRGSEAQAQSSRVVFPDVPASHWALGYVNAAVTPPSKDAAALIRGGGDGKFYPDKSITCAEAIAILMRMLGYADGDVGVGSAWYSGYLAVAAREGLTEGLSLSPDAPIKRGEAARLFAALLTSELKDSTTLYLTKLGGKVTDSTVILSTNATADDGTTGSLLTEGGTYKTGRSDLAAELEGTRGKLLLDKSGKLLAVKPEKDTTYRRISLVSCNADKIVAAGGETFSVSLTTAVWKDEKADTYEKQWAGLRAGTGLVLCYNGSGQLDYIYVAGTSGKESAVVVRSSNITANPFTSLAGGSTGFAMFKNGTAATLSDLRQYDVGVYSKAANAVYVSDLRLTGIYENAYPNATAPTKITVMGKEFNLLPGAVSDMSAFAIGNTVTLLFTTDMQVAGVVSSSAARSTAVGIASMSGTTAKVELLGGQIILEGKTSYTAPYAASLDGQLVTVASSGKGYLSLNKVAGSEATGSYQVASGTIGTKKLASNVKIYEKAGTSTLTEILVDDITVSTVPASKIAFVSYDYAGRVNYLVLSDVTGDGYNYGFFAYEAGTPGSGMDVGTNDTLAIRNADSGGKETTTTPIEGSFSVPGGRPGGMAVTGSGKVASYLTLKSAVGLKRTAFDLAKNTVITANDQYPVWEKVQCYNSTTGSWYPYGYTGLAQALAFSDNITVYFDRAPQEGGKIRMVVVY